MWEDGLIVVTLLHIHSHSSAARTNNHVSLGVNISIDTPSRNMGNNGDNCPEEKICKNENKIVGGCQVEPNTFPWQVGLHFKGTTSICGGTILCPKFILTAAHCIDDCEGASCQPNSCSITSRTMEVSVGQHDYKTADGERYEVKNIIPHPNWAFDCDKTFDDDFAILELVNEIGLKAEKGTKAAAVYLPDPSDPPLTRAANLVVSGWGLGYKIDDYYGDDRDLVCSFEKLNAVKLSQIENGCDKLASFNEDKMICVASKDYPDKPNKGPCSGDSGGPTVWLDKNNDKVKHIGVVSFRWSKECAGLPSVDARVTSIFNNWHMAEELKRCNAKACRAGQCMTGSDLDEFVKSSFFD